MPRPEILFRPSAAWLRRGLPGFFGGLAMLACSSCLAQQVELGSEDIFLSEPGVMSTTGEVTAAGADPFRLAPPGSHQGGGDATDRPLFAAQLQAAEELLARGEALEAAARFEHAATLNGDVPDAELGMVRSYLQAGEYRRALSFATIVAGEHRGAWEAEALLAWLEYLGGQKAFAHQRLAKALAAAPDHPMLRELSARFAALAGDTLPSTPASPLLVPYAAPLAAPESGAWRGLASGVVVDDGRRAMTSAVALNGADGGLWVRNGLGQVSPAVVEKRDTASGVAVLRLSKPFAAAAATRLPAAHAFPGSPCYVVEFPAAALGEPAWPVLSAGFLGRATASPDSVEPVVELPVGPRGGAVLDIGGRLVGLLLPGEPAAGRSGTAARVLLRAGWAGLLPDGPALSAASQGAPVRQPMQAIYEENMPLVVSVLGSR